jgi:hypothetical protein
MASKANSKADVEKKRLADALRSSGSTSGDSAGPTQHPKHRKKEVPSDEAGDFDLSQETPPANLAATLDSLVAAVSMLVARSDEQAQTSVTREAQLATMMASFENKFSITDDHLAKVDAALAKLQARLDGLDADPLTSNYTQAGRPASSSGAPAGAWRPPSSSPPTRSPTRGDNPEWFKVFFDGPSHSLHRLTFGRYWNDQVKPMMAGSLVAGTRIFAGNNPSFAVGFPSEHAAKDFLDNLAAKQGPPDLVDPDGNSHTMKANYQRSKTPTKFGKRLSPIYQHYVDKLSPLVGWLTDFKLVADPHRGRVYIEKGEQLIMIHSLDADGVSLRTFGEGLASYNLNLEDCTATAKLFAVA